MNESIRNHIFVSGKVQGVLFRDRTRRKARQIGVQGWVKNLPDNRVEMLLEGEKEKIQELIEWIKSEPFLVRVDNIEVKLEKYQNEFNNFEVKY